MVHGTSHTCLSGLLLFFKRDKKKIRGVVLS